MASEKFHIKQIPKELRNQEIWSRRAYVDWVNKTLQANFTNTLEFKNGAAYIQLLDSMFPGVVQMGEVKFCAEKQYDCYLNYRILEEAFRKLGINKIIEKDALSSGRHVESWAFLKWFKSFYDHNFDGKDYDPVKARNSAYMGFGKNPKTQKCDPTVSTQSKHVRKLLPHARSKSVIYNREIPKDDDVVNVKVQKTCHSAECLHQKRDAEFRSRPGTPAKISTSGENIGCKVNYCTKISKEDSSSDEERKVTENIPDQTESETTLLNKSMSFTNIIEANLAEDKENETISKELILVRKGYSQGDFNPQIQKEFEATQDTTTNGEGRNINALVVNKTQQYEEFGVSITENTQIRVETLKRTDNNVISERERRRKIVLIEKFLNYQWSERKQYVQTLAKFLKEEHKKTA